MKCVNIKLWDILSCFHYILNAPRTVNSEMFTRILFSRIALKDTFAMLKFALRACFTYIRKQQGDLASSLCFVFS